MKLVGLASDHARDDRHRFAVCHRTLADATHQHDDSNAAAEATAALLSAILQDLNAMASTVSPCGASSRANALVRVRIAPLDAASCAQLDVPHGDHPRDQCLRIPFFV